MQELLKDPYIFDFIGLAEDMKEADLERALTRLLLELGSGLAFMGNQYNLNVPDLERLESIE